MSETNNLDNIDIYNTEFDNYRKLIQKERKQGKDWNKIQNNPKNYTSLQDFFEDSRDWYSMDYSITEDIWNLIVLQEKKCEERQLETHKKTKMGMISESDCDNELSIPANSTSAWIKYKTKLQNEKHFNRSSIKNIEESTFAILKQISSSTEKDNPRKGMVVGNVQSGKTANMTALMAMAADYGWNFFIILSGTIDNLRKQTEDRIFDDLYDNTSDINWNKKDQFDPNAEHGKRLQDLNLNPGQVYFNVCLKNVTRLENMIKWLKKDNHKLAQLKVLIIDDEADQAGINTNDMSDPDFDRTRINELILALVTANYNTSTINTRNPEIYHYAAMNYIGYTATPYANFLNESTGLYPSSFITTLPVSNEYFGPQQIFGVSTDETQNGLGIVRVINTKQDEIKDPTKCEDLRRIDKIHKNNGLELPKTLQDALCWFFCCVACQRFRGSLDPVSMLIHSSLRVTHHQRMEIALREWFNKNSKEDILKLCENIWEIETTKFTKTRFKYEYPYYGDGEIEVSDYPKFLQIKEYLEQLLDETPSYINLDSDENPKFGNRINICVDNGSNNGIINNQRKRLIYPEKDDVINIAPAFIVIGGQTLSRGLTLKGLVSTYFVRNSKQLDTLMQMGRWFGYRRGYELLPRIWLPYETKEQFEFLSDVDDKLRQSIQENASRHISPMECGPIIMNTPEVNFIKITAENRMQGAVTKKYDFSGSTLQTTKFENDSVKLKANIDETIKFINKLKKPDTTDNQKNDKVWLNVNSKIVGDYLNAYQFRSNDVLDRLAKLIPVWVEENINRGNLKNWNVVLASTENSSDKNKEFVINDNVKITKVIRTKLKNDDDSNILSIKALRAPDDMYADLNGAVKEKKKAYNPNDDKDINIDSEVDFVRENLNGSRIPLLVVYVIDKNSKAERKTKELREDLNALNDVVGICIYLPGRKRGNYSAELTINLDN